MQTRKWTDQQGVEKYSTEVVLQRFRGELTLLGGRADTTSGMMIAVVLGGEVRAMIKPLQLVGRLGPASNARENDIDDDIPF